LLRGGVPKWLRERSAKPRFSGSNPLAASINPPQFLFRQLSYSAADSFAGVTTLLEMQNFGWLKQIIAYQEQKGHNIDKNGENDGSIHEVGRFTCRSESDCDGKLQMRRVLILESTDGARVKISLEHWGSGLDLLVRRWVLVDGSWVCVDSGEIAREVGSGWPIARKSMPQVFGLLPT
jgi:hypothetical protein